MADEVWEVWNAGLISDELATIGWWKSLGICFYISVLSAFQIGWRLQHTATGFAMAGVVSFAVGVCLI